ncbi:baculoviral IAP repeat-containing protein 5-like [Lytechinus variegatus]|uniref:baculoviral IAP repeat-containing protein 5-like n=1 Tax=Lytechinus variegatus TaxID=7654 RepID=UPI001BB1AF0D|nr:baculoviral IAP repeat-containing protein 5-like [Lytechinus variegatus]
MAGENKENVDVDTEAEMEEFAMHFEVNRLDSFKDWPFQEDCSCVPQKLAEAGFYHIPSEQEPDAVRCFMCQKELDGWEPDDDPMSEHRKHAPKCNFLKHWKPEEEYTVADFVKSISERQQAKMKRLLETKTKEFQKQAAEVRKQMELLK